MPSSYRKPAVLSTEVLGGKNFHTFSYAVGTPQRGYLPVVSGSVKLLELQRKVVERATGTRVGTKYVKCWYGA